MPVQTPLPSKYLINNGTDAASSREQSGNKWSFLSQIIAAGFRPIVPPKLRRDGFVYFAEAGDLIKIGHSVRPKQRVTAQRSPDGERLKMVAFFRGFMDEEHSIHRLFDAHHARLAEWFWRCPEIENFIELLERHRGPLTRRLVSITDIVFGRHTELLEIPAMTKEVYIPAQAEEFSRWADRECPNWPTDLMVKSSHAADALKGLYRADPASIEVFRTAYRQWAGI